MESEEMYHQIKSLRMNLSIRKVAEKLKISPNTVQKYANMDMPTASTYLKKVDRRSEFEVAYEFIEEKIESHPKISAKKLYRIMKAQYPDITAKVRAFQDFIRPIREKYCNNKIRYYRPVLVKPEDSQVQVDPGEFEVQIDKSGNKFKVYFVVFVFSYSRMMYVSFQTRPYNTDDFINAHLQAFYFFKGVAKEYVYDQTKLVVIQEKYREVLFNQKFWQFSTKYGFTASVCEGYDPESKGKVERAVQYVKNDFLYGEYFRDIEHVRREGINWLNTVANVRIHGTTHAQPDALYEEDKKYINQSFYIKDENNIRVVDKTGLINFEGNKYSVPCEYQRLIVYVMLNEQNVIILDPNTGKEIARHKNSLIKGETFINSNHYRSIQKSIDEIITETKFYLKEVSYINELINRICTDNPKIKRDQLRGLIKLKGKYDLTHWETIKNNLLDLPAIKATLVERMLEISYNHQNIPTSNELSTKEEIAPSSLTRNMIEYNKGLKHAYKN
jgi:transposase